MGAAPIVTVLPDLGSAGFVAVPTDVDCGGLCAPVSPPTCTATVNKINTTVLSKK